MLSNQNIKFQIYDIRCKDLLDEDKIRFAGIINEVGNLIYGGFKKGILPLESDQTNSRHNFSHITLLMSYFLTGAPKWTII